MNQLGHKKQRTPKRVGEHHGGDFGVYMNHKILKLRGQNDAYSGRNSKESTSDSGSISKGIFHGIHIYVDGYTVPSKEELRLLMLQHGGGFEHYQTSKVTHLVATHLPRSKVVELKKMKRPAPVVHPDWIVQSIAQKRLLPMHSFLYGGLMDATQTSILSFSKSASSITSPNSSAEVEGDIEVEVESKPSSLGTSLCSGIVPMFHIDEEESVPHEEVLTEDEGELAPQDREEMTKSTEEPDEEEEEEEAKQDIPSNHLQVDTGPRCSRDGPDFVRAFFAKSRLHHIGTWRNTFLQNAPAFLSKYHSLQQQQQQQQKEGPKPMRGSPQRNDRVILHLDMDCFFVSVAVRNRPDLANVPIAIAHSGNATGTSEVSSCNYLARDFGVKAGIYMETAKSLCPQLVVLPYEFDQIQQVSLQIYELFFKYTPFVQAVSCDEAFLEFPIGTNGLEIGSTLRKEIYERTKCPASVGISFNMLLARLATKKAKPNGIFELCSKDDLLEFMDTLNVSDLPGIGYRTSEKLNEIFGVQSVVQLRQLKKNQLFTHFGSKMSERLYQFARGQDPRPVQVTLNSNTSTCSTLVQEDIRKSISAVINFGIRFRHWQDTVEFMEELGKEIQRRLEENGPLLTRHITLFIKKRRQGQPKEPRKFMGCGICDDYTRSQGLDLATDDPQVITDVCLKLLKQLNLPDEELRGVGIQVSKLVPKFQQKPNTNTLLQAWRRQGTNDPQQEESKCEEQVHGYDQEEKEEEEIEEVHAPLPVYAKGFSQIDQEVLNELPEQIQEEIRQRYRVQANHRHHPLLLIQKRQQQYNKKQSSSTTYSTTKTPPTHTSAITNSTTIRMSQIDEDVYSELPLSIRKEIQMFAKPISKKSTKNRLPLFPEKMKSIHEKTKELRQPQQKFDTIQQLVLKALNHIIQIQQQQHIHDDEAIDPFENIYKRILYEIESHALDQTSQMVRYTRRKFEETRQKNPEIGPVLVEKFNRQVLERVNRDLEKRFHGIFKAIQPMR